MTTATTTCGRCGGTGTYANLGVCFRCNGSGVANDPPARNVTASAARELAGELRAIRRGVARNGVDYLNRCYFGDDDSNCVSLANIIRRLGDAARAAAFADLRAISGGLYLVVRTRI